MSRAEFSAQTKRDAWDRAGGICEAEGSLYGLPEGIRCTWDLKRGVHYDHDDPDANSKDASLENCRCLCVPHHKFKTSTRDRPLIAKTDHQQDMVRGIKARWHRPMAGSRDSQWKRRMDGTVERR